MAIYYPPPSPYLGAGQPLTSEKLPPVLTAVQVDEPPHDQRQWFYRVVNLWNPPLPQPIQLGALSPSISTSRTDTPNPISWANLFIIARTWDRPQGPTQPPRSPPFTTGATVTVNQPPYDGRQWFFKVRAIWDLPTPQPRQLLPLNPQLEAVPVSNPPFRTISPAFYSILAVWNIPSPLTPDQVIPRKGPITASVFSDAIIEAGAATDSLGDRVTFVDAITEAGTPSDSAGSLSTGWVNQPAAGGTWTKSGAAGGTWTKSAPAGGTWTKQ